MGDLLGQFQEPIGLLLRWGHLLAAIVAVGGLFFSRFALLPALDDLDETARQRVHDGVRRAWLGWVMGAITILLLTGVANYLLTILRADTEAWGGDGRSWMRYHKYHAFMGAKILFAFVLFFLASALIGRGEATQWARDDRKKWLTVATGLGVAVIITSGYLRQMHTGPNVVAVDDGGAAMEGGEGRSGRGGRASDEPRVPAEPVPAADEGQPAPGADAPADEAAPTADGTAPAGS